MFPLIEPVSLRVTPLDREAPTDSLARTGSLQRDYKAALDIDAQVDFGRSAGPRNDGGRADVRDGLGGAERESVAIAVVRREDADRLGWSPHRGDRVVSMTDGCGNVDDINLYVELAKYDGPVGGRFTLLKLTLVDEQPRQRAFN
jgi:hypothetical protein